MAKNRRKFTQCPNCGYTFEEVNNYCPNCGQENHDLNVPVKHLVTEFFEGTIHFDTKIWRTLKYLLLKPGLLTEKFNIGQRASYVPPFRLYVFISIFFFAALALRASDNLVVGKTEVPPEEMLKPDSKDAAELRVADSLATATLNQLGQNINPGESGSEVGREIMERVNRFTQNEEQSKQKLLKNVSFMMFILMPFFGLILYLFYYKQRRNYVEHLMFSIHFHTFFFLLTILALGIEFIFNGFDVDSWVFWIAIVYLFFALHRVYKESYLRTFLRLIPLGITYLISLIIFFLGTIAVSVWLS